MSMEMDKPGITDKDQEHNSSNVDEARRKLAQAGLATPVLMTLASKPVLGAQCSPSALASGNLSRPVDMTTCGSCTIGYWGNAPHAQWDETDYAKTDVFNTIFNRTVLVAGTSLYSAVGNSAQIHQDVKDAIFAIKPNANGWEPSLLQLARQAVGALLNASHPTTSYYIDTFAVIGAFQVAFDSFIATAKKDSLVDQATDFDTGNNDGPCPLNNDRP